MKRALETIFPKGAVIGVLFFAGMFLLSLLWNMGFSVMGVENAEAAKLVLTSFWPWIVEAQAKILVVYALLGFFIGWVSELVHRYIPLRFRGSRLLWVFLINLYFLLSNIRKYPQVYAESLYFKGIVFKYVQIFVTDMLPEILMTVYGALLLVVVCFVSGVWLARTFRRKIYIPALAAIIILAFLSHRVYKKPASPKNSGPNVLVLAADSLRHDRLGCENYERDLTPNIDKIAADGVVFRDARTSFPRTFPAVISFLTGRLPVTHGVRHMFPDKYSRDHRRDSVVEVLRKEGYATAVVTDFAGDVFSRMRIGFEKVRSPYFNFITLIDQRSLEVHFLLMPYVTNHFGRFVFPELKEFADNADPFLLAEEVVSTLEGLSKKSRFFCYTFFSNTHFPYASPRPYYSKYTDKNYRGRFKYHKPPTLYEKENLTLADAAQVNAIYDGSVKAFDDAVGMIVGFLKRKGLYDKTIIVVTADHGENLYDNGWYIGHGEHLVGNNVVRVPLVVKFPKGTKFVSEVKCLTRDIDFAPTLLAYLGRNAPKEIDGENLMPVLTGEKGGLKLAAFTETGIWFSDVSDGFFQEKRIMYPDVTGLSRIDFTYNLEVVLREDYEELVNTAKHRMVDDGNYRLIYIPTSEGVEYELYDTAADPLFKKDISKTNGKKFEEMKRLLLSLMKKDRKITFKKGYSVLSRY
ncbi:MAG: sulfatase [Endomicrobiales bacterium]|nr:sulfatase [Endomicrobiales bacterium]